MKTTNKSIKLDPSKLFGFKPAAAVKKNSKTLFARPMIGSKAAGLKKSTV